MTNLRSLINQIHNAVFITIPDDLWNNLYLRLQAYTASIGHSRQSTLLVEKAPLKIQITNLQHKVLLEIPQSITDWSQTTRYQGFTRLPSKVQANIHQITQELISQSNQRRHRESIVK